MHRIGRGARLRIARLESIHSKITMPCHPNGVLVSTCPVPWPLDLRRAQVVWALNVALPMLPYPDLWVLVETEGNMAQEGPMLQDFNSNQSELSPMPRYML